MSGVNPPGDGGHQYYRKKVDELEEEHALAKRRNREAQAKREEKLERAYNAELRKRERSTESAIADARANASEVRERERAQAQEEIARHRARTYDRLGRYAALDPEGTRDQLDSTLASLEQERAGFRSREADREAELARRSSASERGHRDRAERAIEASREAVTETVARQRQAATLADKNRQNERDATYARLNHEMQEGLASGRRRYAESTEVLEQRRERELDQAQRMADERLNKQARAFARREESAAASQRASHDRDTRAYRTQIAEYLENERLAPRERANGAQEAVRRYENEHRAEKTQIADSFLRDLQNERAKSREAERNFTAAQNAALKEKDTHFAQVIGRMGQEHRREMQDTSATFQRDREAYVRQAEHEEDRLRESGSRQLQESNHQRELALEKQAKAYQQTIDQNRIADETRIRTLEKALVTHETTEDPNLISPAAEASVRRSLGREYQDNFEAERARNARSEDSIRRSYNERLRDTIADADSQATRLRLEHATDRQDERTTFLAAIDETQHLAQRDRLSLESEQDRQLESLTRTYEEAVKKQQRQTEDQLAIVRNDTNARLATMRQEHEFEMKMAQRAFSTRQNELIREYEKKLTDQRLETDSLVASVKEETQKQLREAERQQRAALEDQARSYEHRIAQMEFQQKERERFLAQSHEDTLDKVKRSHAALLQRNQKTRS
jgi:hypothetical protein